MLEHSLEQAELSERHAPAISFARSAGAVLEAQRLRYKIFAEEMNARVTGAATRIDCDIFDARCDHRLVREAVSGKVIGTNRLLPGRKARHFMGG